MNVLLLMKVFALMEVHIKYCEGWGLTISGDYAYQYFGNDNRYFISILDISNLNDIYVANTIEIPWHGILKSNDDLLIMNPAYNEDIWIFDISDPTYPERISTWSTVQDIESFQINGDYLYVNAGRGGLRLVNISDPHNPYEVGFYITTTKLKGISFNENLIYVTDAKNLYSFDCSKALSAPLSLNHQPSFLTLLPAYPNPFNSNTTIAYTLPYQSNVTMAVYNPLGQRIATLFEGNRQSGSHTTILNAGNLPSGIYFVRLEGLNKSITSKIMLIK